MRVSTQLRSPGRLRTKLAIRLQALAVLLLLGILTGACTAQPLNSAAGNSGEPRYYVEILVFQRDTAQESLYRFPGEPDANSALDLWPVYNSPFGHLGTQSPVSGSPLLPVTDLFVAMPEERLVMTREWQALAAEPGLVPLTQRGWHQPAATFGDPQPVRVHGGDIVDSIAKQSPGIFLGSADLQSIFAVDGTAALERGRFLHLRLDLAIHLKGRRGAPHYGDIGTLEQPGNYTTHRITERRQVSLNAVNYFDHRFFGVVALVKSWPLDSGEQQEN